MYLLKHIILGTGLLISYQMYLLKIITEVVILSLTRFNTISFINYTFCHISLPFTSSRPSLLKRDSGWADIICTFPLRKFLEALLALTHPSFCCCILD